jgi:methylated-DNA-[protein]-cysteine S-methyltransferase
MTTQQLIAYYQSPIGTLEITGTEAGVVGIRFLNDMPAAVPKIHPALATCVQQLDEYFEGNRREFTVPLQLSGTGFQQRVWAELLKIPFGVTRSYLEVAEALGDRNAVRAVGLANGQNPIPIVVPCHRVIGSDGSLTGYGGGLWRKQWLLEHEGRPTQQRLFP